MVGLLFRYKKECKGKATKAKGSSLVFTVESMGHIPMPQPVFSGRMSEELSQVEVMRGAVPYLLGKLKSSKSPNPDGIYPRVLRDFNSEIVDILTFICNLSLNLTAVPEDWRVANVTLIFIKGL